MLRFILKKKWRDGYNGAEGDGYFTLDIDVPNLEAALGQCGFSEHSYDMVQLVGVEMLPSVKRAAAQGDA